ncbi:MULTISPECIES: RdgB/HAM1 family non-canonical purine NTP pyrophosphatase [Candidatus Ichthyocystis]|uniref:RdgB/HAM1 family non-canonical purine NTP pyrophosphatase n=1 Tax=Candidatus Ichthyocystis TaxID=2929841 RepID=UPI000B2BC8D1|nr:MULTISPECIES: RdgB/HAM1 family non-canonical purine NTP pyrophosphatase [Ichthyocystis]
MKEIVIATNNNHKFSEIVSITQDWGVNCLSLNDFTCSFSYDEPYFSFMENALHKAREVSKLVSLPVLADDSGICVDALNGKPGVFSSRYSEDGTDESNRRKLLSALHGISNRQATFICVMVLIRSYSDLCPLVSYGFWSGCITLEEVGETGFGYDRIFLPLGCKQTAAEMPPSSKRDLSHRAQAIRKMREEILRCPWG